MAKNIIMTNRGSRFDLFIGNKKYNELDDKHIHLTLNFYNNENCNLKYSFDKGKYFSKCDRDCSRKSLDISNNMGFCFIYWTQNFRY